MVASWPVLPTKRETSLQKWHFTLASNDISKTEMFQLPAASMHSRPHPTKLKNPSLLKNKSHLATQFFTSSFKSLASRFKHFVKNTSFQLVLLGRVTRQTLASANLRRPRLEIPLWTLLRQDLTIQQSTKKYTGEVGLWIKSKQPGWWTTESFPSVPMKELGSHFLNQKL